MNDKIHTNEYIIFVVYRTYECIDIQKGTIMFEFEIIDTMNVTTTGTTLKMVVLTIEATRVAENAAKHDENHVRRFIYDDFMYLANKSSDMKIGEKFKFKELVRIEIYDPENRRKGYGSEALQTLIKLDPKTPIVVSVGELNHQYAADKYEQGELINTLYLEKVPFYMKNGFVDIEWYSYSETHINMVYPGDITLKTPEEVEAESNNWKDTDIVSDEQVTQDTDDTINVEYINHVDKNNVLLIRECVKTGIKTRYFYDDKGRICHSVSSDGKEVKYVYSDDGQSVYSVSTENNDVFDGDVLNVIPLKSEMEE